MGLIILFVGLAVTIISNLQNQSAINPILGAILTIVSSIFLALFFITEEIFVRKFEIDSALGVFWEGVWGILFSSLLIVIFNFVDDPFNVGHKMEDTLLWI
jgi:drug/metabolite transporter (DMT)-like permease